MTRRELLDRMSASEVMEWAAYFELKNQDEKEAYEKAKLQQEAEAGVSRLRGNRGKKAWARG